MIKFSNFTALLLLLLIIACSDTQPDKRPVPVPEIVAQVDDLSLTETSFQRAYLPVLLYGDKFDNKESREEVINYLIGQKLLSQLALEADLDTIGIIQHTRDQVERKAMSRQLYQKWVKAGLQQPTEAELRTGFIRGHKSLFVRHLFSKSIDDIQKYQDRLSEGSENFYTLAQDVFSDTLLSRNGGALGWITFGDLDESLEEAAYSLKPGEYSQPIKSQYGWHILSVDDYQEEILRTEDEYLQTRDLIFNKINERRENILGKEVLNEFMGQFEIDFQRDVTAQVWPLVIQRLEAEKQGLQDFPGLSEIDSELELLQDETLLSVNGEDWSVRDILKLFPTLDRSLLYGNLYIAASNVIRDEMLSREAYKLGLENHPDVVEEVRDVYDQLLADTYVNQIADTLTFTKNTQKSFYNDKQLQLYHAPDSLLIETFAFPDSLVAVTALYQLRNGLISTDPTDTRTWLTAKDQDSPLYQLTRTISLGTTAGPITDGKSWILSRLLERRRTALVFETVQEKVLADMEADRFSATRNILLKDIRPKHQISINYDILNR